MLLMFPSHDTANAKESEANTAYTNELRRKAQADTRTARANATIRESEAPAAKARSKVDANRTAI